MKINNVDFNAEWAKSVDEPAFVKHFLPIVWPDTLEDDRKKKLSTAYELLTGKKAPESQQSKTKTRAARQPEGTTEGAE
jgi:hypothetical protein